MPTVKLLSGTLMALTVAAALTGFRAAPAATTWTVTPGGAFTGAAATLTMTDTTSSMTVSCTAAGAGGTLKKGSKLPGAGLGMITSFIGAKQKCTGPAGIPFTLSGVKAVKWPLNAASYDAAKGMTSGTITHIHFTASAAGICSVTVDGTGATASNGMVKITYTNTGAKLQLKATGNLHLYKVSMGCGHTIKTGDGISLSATYKLTPAQKITSP